MPGLYRDHSRGASSWQASAIARILCEGAGHAPLSIALGQSPRERSAEGRVRSNRAAQVALRGRLSALHCGVFSGAGPRFWGRLFSVPRIAPGPAEPPPSASSSQRVIVPAGGAPAPPGSLGGCVHPPPAGAASCSIIKTPLDDALG